MTFRRFAALVFTALSLTFALPGLASAQSVVRIEFQLLAAGDAAKPAVLFSGQTMTASGTAQLSAAAPSFGAVGCGVARVTVVSGAVDVAWGPAPVAVDGTSLRIEQGPAAEKDILICTGQFLSILQAANQPAAGAGGPVTAGAASFADGWNITLGTEADSACATDIASCTEEALLKRLNQRATSILGALGSPFQLGGSIGNTSFGLSGNGNPAFVTTNHELQVASPVVQAFTAAPTVTASSAYASGNAVGGLLTITSVPNSGTIQNVTLDFKSAQTAAFDVLFFNANPTNSTFTDKSPVAVAVADFATLMAPAQVATCVNTGTTSVCFLNNIAHAYSLPAAGSTLYAVIVTRGTPTFTATSDVSLRVNIFPDQ